MVYGESLEFPESLRRPLFPCSVLLQALAVKSDTRFRAEFVTSALRHLDYREISLAPPARTPTRAWQRKNVRCDFFANPEGIKSRVG